MRRRVPLHFNWTFPVWCQVLKLSETNWTVEFVGGYHSGAIHGHGGLNLSVLHCAETWGPSHPVVQRHIPQVRRPLRITVLVTTCCPPDNIKLDRDAMMNAVLGQTTASLWETGNLKSRNKWPSNTGTSIQKTLSRGKQVQRICGRKRTGIQVVQVFPGQYRFYGVWLAPSVLRKKKKSVRNAKYPGFLQTIKLRYFLLLLFLVLISLVSVLNLL